jgi:hypothetical protein
MTSAEPRFCSAPPPPVSGAGVRSRGIMLNASYWGKGTQLRVGFIGGSVVLRERVRDLANIWLAETGANLGFEFWIDPAIDPGPAEIRIAFAPETGSWSHLGKFARSIAAGDPTMNLGWMSEALDEDSARAVVLHEFGHALGLIHEHLSPIQPILWNRERVIADLKSRNGWDDATIEVNMFSLPGQGEIFATDLDPQSIMMYPIPSEWTVDGFTAPWNTRLTALDKKLVREAYGPRPGAPPLAGG